jgi:chloramphenicol-sensitive protein RarD
VETTALFLPALGYLLWIGHQGESTFTGHGAGHMALLVGSGAATAIPLMLFGAAAIRLPLTTLGLLQYLAPVIQFLIGVLIDHEPMPLSRLAGFVLVWIALAIFTVDAIRSTRRTRALAAAVPAPA